MRASRQLDQVLRGEARLADGSPVSAGPVARAAALLSVVVCAVSASFGLGTMRRTLRDHLRPTTPTEQADEFHGPSRNAVVFFVWTGLFGPAGMQMSWVLRPFVGNPEQPVSFYRAGA